MKSLNLFFLVLFTLLLQTYCTDPCKEVNCNNGSCVEGICNCDEGYEGEDCSTRKSLRFTGLWEGNFDCGNLSENGRMEIADDESDIRALSLNSQGLDISFDGITFNLDDTPLEARINANYTGFVIDTQNMTIQIPNNPGISAYVFGAGDLLDEQTLDIRINVKNDDFGAAFTCEGKVSR